MMTVLAGRGRGIHSDNNFRTQRAHQPDESFQGLLLTPLVERGGEAFGVSPVELVQEIAVTNSDCREAVTQLGLAQSTQRSTALCPHHVAAALAARAIDIGDNRGP